MYISNIIYYTSNPWTRPAASITFRSCTIRIFLSFDDTMMIPHYHPHPHPHPHHFNRYPPPPPHHHHHHHLVGVLVIYELGDLDHSESVDLVRVHKVVQLGNVEKNNHDNNDKTKMKIITIIQSSSTEGRAMITFLNGWFNWSIFIDCEHLL